MRFIPDENYKFIVKKMPILVVDLFVKLESGQYILVRRANEPLRDQWWIPGGRVLKGEEIKTAAYRIAKEELGLLESDFRFDPIFRGYYNAFYTTSAWECDTHTTSLLFEFHLNHTFDISLDDQSLEMQTGPIPQEIIEYLRETDQAELQ